MRDQPAKENGVGRNWVGRIWKDDEEMKRSGVGGLTTR